jgi:hypothetical protein
MKALATNALGIPGQTTGEAAFSLFIFTLGLGATAAFGYLLLTEPTRLNEMWEWTRSLPLLAQGLVWLLLLPWMIALWIWVTPWALPIRLLLVASLLLFTNWLLFPWKA